LFLFPASFKELRPSDRRQVTPRWSSLVLSLTAVGLTEHGVLPHLSYFSVVFIQHGNNTFLLDAFFDNNFKEFYYFRSRGSSVSIVSDHELDDLAIGVRSPTGAKDFSSSLCVQTGSGAHPAPVQWVLGVLSPGLKRGRGVTLTAHPHLVSKSRMSRSYTSSPPKSLRVMQWNSFSFYEKRINVI
jgi:hypothetical protein